MKEIEIILGHVKSFPKEQTAEEFSRSVESTELLEWITLRRIGALNFARPAFYKKQSIRYYDKVSEGTVSPGASIR